MIANLANQFHENGHQVGLINTLAVENEYPVQEGVERFYLEQKDEGKQSLLKRNVSRIKKLRKIVKENKPDVLISFLAEPNFRNILACRGLKTKTILSVRNDPNKEYGSKLTRFLAKSLFKKADGMVFQTEDARAWFPKKIQRKSIVLFNQVNPVFYEQKFSGERKHIVTVGRLMKQKNHELLIRAFAAIHKEIADDLCIYGEGELREPLQSLIDQLGVQDRVHLLGAKNEIEKEIAGARLFVLPSDHEGMPNVLLEAMALGLPCISTDCPCGGPRALIQDGENGWLTSVGNVEEMSKAIKEALSLSKEERDRVGKNASVTAEQFQPEKIFKQWEEYVLSVVGTR